MKGRYTRISYNLEPNAPVFAGNPSNQLETVDSFKLGANWNSYSVKLFTHNGSHIDAPNHFDQRGKKISDFKINDFAYERPFLVDIPKGEGEGITVEELAGCPEKCDLLLIRTGFWRKRKNRVYISNNPWLSPEAAHYLRSKFKRLRAIGIDTISIASSCYPGPGNEAHRILLGNRSRLVIIEDLNLGIISCRAKIKRIFAVPLFVSGVDSMPCTAFAEVEDE